LKALALAVVATALFVGPAQAITYGSGDGNLHLYVGALVGTFEDGTYPFCSGSLVSETVFVTAAHCADEGLIGVTFDAHYTSRSKIHTGIWYQHPGYYGGADNPLDVAVIVLDKPVRGPTAEIAPLGLLDEMKAAGTLTQSTQFTRSATARRRTSRPTAGEPRARRSRTSTRASTRSGTSTRSARATSRSRRTSTQAQAAPATATRAARSFSAAPSRTCRSR
jgi:hypothetical protein